MSKFFISYSTVDRAFARKLRKQIAVTDNAHTFFLDSVELPAGAKIAHTLQRRIEWCDFFIILLSGNSTKSKWVKFELECALENEIQSGQKKIFPVLLDDTDIPKMLDQYLAIDFSVKENFTGDFFRLMNGIYQRPTHYEILYKVKEDPKEGYLFDMYVSCDDNFRKLIKNVEYRFDYEFDSQFNKQLEGCNYLAKGGQFAVRNVWTNQSATVFVAIYLKNTRAIYFKVFVEVGVPIN
jgi:hypothetical protein